jgi:hypothetical protein
LSFTEIIGKLSQTIPVKQKHMLENNKVSDQEGREEINRQERRRGETGREERERREDRTKR